MSPSNASFTARMGFPFQLSRYHALGREIGICDWVSASDWLERIFSLLCLKVPDLPSVSYNLFAACLVLCRQLACYTGPTSMSLLILAFQFKSWLQQSVKILPFQNCSWGPSKCYFWKRDGDDYLDICAEKWNDSCRPAVTARLYIIKHATSAWVCFLCWWACPSS